MKTIIFKRGRGKSDLKLTLEDASDANVERILEHVARLEGREFVGKRKGRCARNLNRSTAS